VVEPRYRWQFPDAAAIDPALAEVGERLGIGPRLTALLAARGVADESMLRAFLAPPEAGLHDPFLLPDADRFVERIERARRDGETVMVFGDFDADGVTGLAILILAMRRLGVRAVPYVPSRLDEGHGLSLAGIAAARETGAAVLVTVDCGTTSRSEVAIARDGGIDVLISDHHHVPEELPPALAIVNPHRPDSLYPDPRLAGSGVAFKLAAALLAGTPDGQRSALDLADLATIGSVADLVPVMGETRSIVRLGLDEIRRGPRAGIAALLGRAGVDPSRVDVETISFALAPRLNAAGRVGEALDAVRLLLAESATEAEELATALETANATRRDLTKQVVAEARALVRGDSADDDGGDGQGEGVVDGNAIGGAALGRDAIGGAPAILVRGAWPVGIVGLVASRLADDTGLPAVVGADVGSTVRASCRGDGRLHLAGALESCSDLLLRHGGHAGAAGFELITANWDPFRVRFLALAAVAAPADPRPVLRLDIALAAPSVDYALQRDLGRLAPFGAGNAEPLVAVLGMTVVRAREASGGHSQLVLRRDRDVVDGIAFGRPELATLVEGDRVDVVGRLMSRSFGGFESLQIEIRDVATSGLHPEAAAILAASGPARQIILAGAPA
jgi:single-stranded-DNA-specific exonuclease